MDASELAAAARKALEFTHAIGACEFTLLTPTRQQVRECLYRHKMRVSDDEDPLMQALVQRYLLDGGHLVGWTGVRRLHVLGEGADPLPWSRAMVPLLLDAQPGWADKLGEQLILRMNQRVAEIKEQAGN